MWKIQPNLETTEKKLGDTFIYQYYENSEISGYPIKYIRAIETENNSIFGESTARQFLNENGFDMSCKRDDDTMFQGGEVYGGFGYTPMYNQVIYLSVKYFDDNEFLPEVDDIIYDKTDNLFFQISKVDTKNEEQGNIRINNLKIAYKIYLKQYSFGHKDDFETDLTDELQDYGLEEDFLEEDLANINLDLSTEIDNMNIVNNNRKDSVFGDLG